MEPDDDRTQTHVVLTKAAMMSHYRIADKDIETRKMLLLK